MKYTDLNINIKKDQWMHYDKTNLGFVLFLFFFFNRIYTIMYWCHAIYWHHTSMKLCEALNYSVDSHIFLNCPEIFKAFFITDCCMSTFIWLVHAAWYEIYTFYVFFLLYLGCILRMYILLSVILWQIKALVCIQINFS